MRIHVGPIPDEFTPDGSWRPIKEPGPVLMQVFALPIGIGLMLAAALGWRHTGVHFTLEGHGLSTGLLVAGLLLSIPLLILVHELLHAAAHPHWGCTRETIIGLWPGRLVFYAHYSGPRSRNRFLLVLAVPFLVITLLPLLMAEAGLLPGAAAPILEWFSIWNALASCGDFFGFFLILFQVPARAVVQNQSWRTYWKPA